jgi:sec-independent protein translocase protein TatB
MFDFAWSEIGLIAAVALVLIGPKDMPVAIRAITDMVKKARRMASEFQTHVDEMVREANLDEVRSSINELRNFDIKGAVTRTVDPDGSLRSTFTDNPLNASPGTTTADTTVAPAVELGVAEPAGALADVAVAEHPAVAVDLPAEAAASDAGAEAAPAEPPAAEPDRPLAPAFVPPALVPHAAAADRLSDAPAFIPPEVVLQRRSRPGA